MSLETDLLFPTALASADLEDADLLCDLVQSIWMLEEGDEAGSRWCEEQGYDGYTSYASLDDLPERASAFAALKARLDVLVAAFATERSWNLGDQTLVLDSFWVNILGEGGAHSGHIHPNAIVSGTVYVDMPDGAGAIRFEDPRLPLMMAAPQPVETAEEVSRRFIYRTPPAGRILMWESWLRHEVMPNRSDQPRLTISFNYASS